MDKDCIIFDLDGTLTDSGPGIMNCAIYAYEKLGLAAPDEAGLRKFVGPPLHESFMKNGMSEELAHKAILVYRERYGARGIYENEVYPGIYELLSALKDAGKRLFVGTSKPEKMTFRVLEHFDLLKYFDHAEGALDAANGDTKADVLRRCMAAGNISAENALMIGDTVYDVIGAAGVGIPCIGVAWGYGDKAKMEEAGMAAYAASTGELSEMLI